MPIHSGASACAIATRSPARPRSPPRSARRTPRAPFGGPRTRATGDDLAVLDREDRACTFSRSPASAAARPMRPPRCRYSSVSSVNTTLALALEPLDERRRSPHPSSPASSRRWIACASIAIASEAVRESTTRTRSPPTPAAASSRALERPGQLRRRCAASRSRSYAAELLVGREEVLRASAATSPAVPATCAASRRTRRARARRSPCTSRRRSGRRAARSACSGSARAPPG